MFKGLNARRRQRTNRKLAAQRGLTKRRMLHAESLEERALLAITAAGFLPGGGSTTEGTVGSGPVLQLSVDAGGAAIGDSIFFSTFALASASNAEASDFTLTAVSATQVLPGPATYTFNLTNPPVGGTGGLTINNDTLVEGTEILGISVIGLPPVTGTSTTTIHTILDNETATVSLGGTVTEQGGAQSFPVTLTTFTPDTATGTEAKLEDSYTATITDALSGSAQNSSGTNPDYVTFPAGGLPITFGVGAGNGSVAAIPLTTINDFVIEGTETVNFNLTEGAATVPPLAGSAVTYVNTTTTGTVNISDDDTAYITFTDAAGNPYGSDMEVENAIGGDTKVYARLNLPAGVSLSQPLKFDVKLDNSAPNSAEYGSFTSPFGAIGDGDFTIAAPTGVTGYTATGQTRTHTFPIGAANGATILFDLDHESGPYDDNYLEGDEVVSLIISNLVSGTTPLPNPVPVGSATRFDLTIKDNETGTVAISQTNSPVTEGLTTPGAPQTGISTANFQLTVTPTGGAQFPLGGAGSFAIPVSYGGTATDWDLFTTVANPAPVGPTGNGTGAADYDSSNHRNIVVNSSGVATWMVPVISDLAVEGTETVIASIPATLTALGGVTASTASATTEILDDDTAEVRFETTDNMTREGLAAMDPEDNCDGDPNGPSTAPGPMGPGCGSFHTGNAVNDFTDDDGDMYAALYLPGTSTRVVSQSSTTVHIKEHASTTTVAADFNASAGNPLVIPAGQNFAHIAINEVNDNIVEPTEIIAYEFDTAVNNPAQPGISAGDANISVTSTVGSVQIKDNDTAKLRIRAGDPLAGEATPADTGNFQFELVDGSGNPIATSANIPVTFSIAGGLAGLGTDYNLFAIGGLLPSLPLNAGSTLTVSTLTIPAGQTSVGVLVVPVDDTTAEPTENVILEFNSAAIPAALAASITNCSSLAVGSPQTDQVLILDNEGPQQVTITTADMNADEDPVAPAPTSGPLDNQVVFTISIANPVATATTGTLTYTNGADVNTGLTPSDYTITPPAGGSTATNFVIPAGATSISYILTAVDDNIVEDLETVDIKITAVTNPTVTTTISAFDTIQAKINDNKDKATIFVEGIANTDETGTQIGRFNFNMVTSGDSSLTPADGGGSSDTTTTVNFTLGGTASASEYTVYLGPTFGTATPVVLTPIAGVYTLTFAAGDNLEWVQVVGNQDTLLEGAESIVATLSGVNGDVNIANATTSTPAAIAPLPTTPSVQASPGAGNATVWILDDDAGTVRVTAIDPFAAEDNTGAAPNPAGFLFSINLPASSVAANVTLVYSATPGSPGATPGTDTDIGATGTVMIPAGSNSVFLPVNILNDLISEGDEFMNVSIAGISVPGLLGMTIDTSARAGAGTTTPPTGDCYSTFCSATYSNDNMKISDDDIGEAWLYRSTDIINFPWNTTEESGQKANFFVQLTNPTTTSQTVRFSVGGTTNPANLGQTPDVELSYQAPTVGTPDLMTGPGPGSTTSTVGSVVGSGLALGAASPAGAVLKFVGINPSTGREDYDVTIPAGQQVAHLQVMAIDDMIVEGTEHIDIDLEPAANQPGLSSFYSPSGTVNNATLYVTETDVANITYNTDPSPPNEVTELLLSPEGTAPGAGTTGNLTIKVDKAIEGTLAISYDQLNITTTSADYSVNYGLFPSTTPDPTGNGQGFYLLSNTGPNWTATIPVTSTPDAIAEPDEKFKIITRVATHNNPGVTPTPGLTFAGGMVDITDSGIVEIDDDDIVTLTVSSPIDEVDTTTTPSNTTKGTMTIGVQAGTASGFLNYNTSDGVFTAGKTDGAKSGGALGAGLSDYVPVSGTVYWDGPNNRFCTTSACTTVIGPTFSFDVTVNGDDVAEGNQFFNVNVSNGGGGFPAFSPISSPVSITDNDTVKISISNDVVVEPVSGFVSHPITFVADKAIEGQLKLDVAVAPGNGLGNANLVGAVIDGDGTTNGRQNDYTGPGGTNASAVTGITWGMIGTSTVPGASGSLILPVEINADLWIEADESINVHITNVTHTGVNTSWTAPYATGPGGLSDEVLIDDSDAAQFNINSVTVTEGAPAVLTVTMDDLSPGNDHKLQNSLSFPITPTNGTGIGGAFGTTMVGIQPASQGPDYTPTPPVVTFAANTGNGATATGSFATNDEMIIEATEVFTAKPGAFPGTPTTLNFAGSIPSANANNITFGSAGTVTINDNDSAKVVITSTSGAEGGADGSFTFTLRDATGAEKVTDEDTFIQLVVSGSAIRGTDYVFSDPSGVIVPPSGPSSPTTLFVRIPAGQSSVSIGVDITDDAAPESTENVVLTVGAVNNVPFPRNITFITSGIPASGSSNITDNDGGTGTGPFTPTNIFVSGSTWGSTNPVTPYRLTNNVGHTGASGYHGRTLPWAHLNTITVNYTGTAPAGTALTLSDATLVTTFVGASAGTATWSVVDPANPLAGLITGVTNQIGVKNDLTISASGGSTLSVTVDVVPGDINASFLTDIGDILAWVGSGFPATSGTAPSYSDVDGSGLTDIGDVNAIIFSNGAQSLPLAAPLDAVFAEDNRPAQRGLGTVQQTPVEDGDVVRRRGLVGRRFRDRGRSLVNLDSAGNTAVQEETRSVDDAFASLDNDRFSLSQF